MAKKKICVVNAGAGTGKTYTVVKRVIALLEKGVKPEKILMITFSDAGAKEMRARIEAEASSLGIDISTMHIMTFNAFDYEVAKHFWKELGYKRELTVLQPAENMAVINEVLDDNPIYEWSGNSFKSFDRIDKHAYGFKGAVQIAALVFDAIRMLRLPTSQISVVDIREQDPSITEEAINSAALQKLISLFDVYMEILKNRGVVTYEDQVILAERVLNEIDPDYLKKAYDFEEVIVDEFQDSNEQQIWLINRIMDTPGFKHAVFVGDDAQAIYGSLRHTSPEFILNPEEYFPDSDITHVALTENRRSTQPILDFAQKPLDRNTSDSGKRLVSTRGDGAPVVVKAFVTKKDEYTFILKDIKAHIDAGEDPPDIAFLAATKKELNTCMDMATKMGIPAAFYAPQPAMENSRILAILAFARYLKDASDTQDMRVVANALLKADDINASGLMDLPEEEREKYEKKVSGAAYAINTSDDIAAKKQMFLDLVASFSMEDEAVDSFTDSISNKDYDEILTYCGYFEKYGVSTEFRRKGKYSGVAFSTIHSAKGLEWKTVYVSIDCVYKPQMSKRSIEEARRLIFVGGTRARDELTMTGCYESSDSNKYQVNMNPFVREMMEDAGQLDSFDSAFDSIVQKKSVFSGRYVAS